MLDHYLPGLLDEGMYHPDGQIDDEVYVYGSFLQSKMYQRGVTCRDCHDVHRLGLLQPGNALCLQCRRHARRPLGERRVGDHLGLVAVPVQIDMRALRMALEPDERMRDRVPSSAHNREKRFSMR